MKTTLLLSSLSLLTLFTSCEKEMIEFPLEEESVEIQSNTTNEIKNNSEFIAEAPKGAWKLEKIIDRSGNDVTTSCNKNDFLVFKNDTEFSETRFLKKGQACEKTGSFNFTSFEKNGKIFFTEPGKDELKGSYEFKNNKLIVVYFDTIITETTVTYSK